MTGIPPLPTVDDATGELRRDGSKTDRHGALPRNVETCQKQKQSRRKDGLKSLQLSSAEQALIRCR